jgi:hypothetical protein
MLSIAGKSLDSKNSVAIGICSSGFVVDDVADTGVAETMPYPRCLSSDSDWSRTTATVGTSSSPHPS